MTGPQLLRIYYALTPVFMALDWALGVNARTAALDGSGWRWAWYASCLAIAFIPQPKIRSLAALVESALGFFLLLLSVLLPVITAAELVYQGNAPELLTPARLVNFLLSGSLTIGLFYHHLADLRQ